MYYTKNSNKNYYKENESNTNCGSFALNIEEWYEPDNSLLDDNWEVAEEMYDTGNYTNEEIIKVLFDRSIKGILKDFEDEIRLIPSVDAPLNNDEELIAFRIGTNFWADPVYSEDVDVDFHFQVLRDGKWQEKFGSGAVSECPCGNLRKDWETPIFIYEGPTAYFAHKV